jgi:mannose-6-phosphate isomerase-like protein (cupin superfamily)
MLFSPTVGAPEREATEIEWRPPAVESKCDVLLMHDTEVSIFNQDASLDRHYHKFATEIYTLLKGRMQVEVEDQIWELEAGDTMIVTPGTVHRPIPGGAIFLSNSSCEL